MKIMVSYRGIPHAPGWATGDHLVKAFRELGHEAVPYGRYHTRPGADGSGRELCGLPMGPSMIDPDLIVFLECGDQDAQYVELAAYRCPKVFWDFDTLLHVEASQHLMVMLQPKVTFVANINAIPAMPDSRYLPYAAPDVFFRPESHSDPRGGVAMIGSPFPERKEFAEKVGVKFGSLNHQDYLRSLWRLKIHVHYMDSGGAGLLVMRIFETLASGAMLMTQYTPALMLHFCSGIHCVTYTSPGDCREKIDWWIDRPDEMAVVCSNAVDAVRREHRYIHRAQRILEAAS